MCITFKEELTYRIVLSIFLTIQTQPITELL